MHLHMGSVAFLVCLACMASNLVSSTGTKAFLEHDGSIVHPPHHPHYHHAPAPSPIKPPHPLVKPPTKPPSHPPVKPPSHPPIKPPTKPPSHPPVKPPTYAPVKSPSHPPAKPPSQPPTKPPVDQPPTYPPIKSPTFPSRSYVAVRGVVYCKSCKYVGIPTLTGASPLSGQPILIPSYKTNITPYIYSLINFTTKS